MRVTFAHAGMHVYPQKGRRMNVLFRRLKDFIYTDYPCRTIEPIVTEALQRFTQKYVFDGEAVLR